MASHKQVVNALVTLSVVEGFTVYCSQIFNKQTAVIANNACIHSVVSIVGRFMEIYFLGAQDDGSQIGRLQTDWQVRRLRVWHMDPMPAGRCF